MKDGIGSRKNAAECGGLQEQSSASSRVPKTSILARSLTAQSREDIELHALKGAVIMLADLCTQAISQGVQHYRTSESWTVGTLPDFASPADDLETRVQALLGHSQLLPEQFQAARNLLKCVASLRSAFGGTRYAAQLSWLLQGAEARSYLWPLVCRVGDASLMVARRAGIALERNDSAAAREAQALSRQLGAARQECEYAARMEIRAEVPPRRIARAAVWSFAIAGEEMARLANGVVLRAEDW